MTRVIFYIGVAHPEAFLRRFLQSKIYAAGQTALIAGDEATIRQMDDALWLDGFLPHVRLEDGVTRDTPIALTCEPPPADYAADVLISLWDEQPSFAGQFPVYVDIVGAGDEAKKRGRKRYRYFQEHGYPIHYHSVS